MSAEGRVPVSAHESIQGMGGFNTSPRVLIIENLHAGGRDGKFLQQEIDLIQAKLSCSGFLPIHCVTEGRNHAETIVKDALSKYTDLHLIMVKGGDGTLNEAIRPLIGSGLNIAVGVIRSGSVNLVAKELGYERDIASLLKDSVIIDADTGLLTNENGNEISRFLAVADVGLGGKIARDAQRSKKIPGLHGSYPYYVIAALKNLDYRGRGTKIAIDGNEFIVVDDLLMAIFQNTSLYAGLETYPGANMADGVFGGVIVRGDMLSMPNYIARVIKDPRAEVVGKYTPLVARRLRIQSDDNMALHLQADGEALGIETQAVDMSVVRGSLKMLVPGCTPLRR